MKKDGILDDMNRRGIEFVQLYCVDNILVKIGDPLFTGYCIEKGAECANKVVPKGFPTESVGITAQVDGKYQVLLTHLSALKFFYVYLSNTIQPGGEFDSVASAFIHGGARGTVLVILLTMDIYAQKANIINLNNQGFFIILDTPFEP